MKSRAKRINIIRWDNGWGLSRDTTLLVDILQTAGFKITVFPSFWKPNFRAKLAQKTSQMLRHRPIYDINLFIEDIIPEWLAHARVNCLIPNQEWFRDKSHPYLSQIDLVLCKTLCAKEIFTGLGCQTELISFTSCDRFNPQIAKNHDTFFHLSTSPQKGTNAVIEVWQRHPEWPCLTLLQNPKFAREIKAENIKYHAEYVSDELLSQYQNACGIHLCPSEAEGFGHHIVEAMSCQSVAIATNAPPMNEIVTSERGILVDYAATQNQLLGKKYFVDPQDLEQKIEEVLGMDLSKKKHLGEQARDWYLQNDQFFRQRLVEVLLNV